MKRTIRFARWLLAMFMVVALLGRFGVEAASAEVFAAAASLKPVMEKVAIQFEKDKGIRMDGVYGASGQLAKQIEMGAPYDLYLSADEKWANYLEQKGKLEKVRPVAECPLVLWWAAEKAPSLDLVKDAKVRVAIADPAVAPYGVLAKSYLEKAKLYGKIEKENRLVIAGDVLKAGLAAKSGGADAAYIPLSIAMGLGGSWTKVPVPPQCLFGGIVKGRTPLAALVLFDYLKGPQAVKLFRDAGFEPVPR